MTVDSRTELTVGSLDDWIHRRGVELDHTCADKPTGDGLLSSFNGRRCDECLNVNNTHHDSRRSHCCGRCLHAPWRLASGLKLVLA